jgi:PiT family inorganic phosphate transporter
LAFDFTNGMHDAANSISTVVSTRVLTPKQAVVWAAFFNFIAFEILGLHVASAIGKDLMHPEVVDLTVIGAGLISAIVWNLVTWWFGIPSSSSHTLVGGLVGAAIAKAGFGAVFMGEVIKIILFIFMAPLIGMAAAVVLSIAVLHICKNMSPFRVDKNFRRLQLLSSAAYSLGHGSNDAQKMMGVIFIAVVSGGFLKISDPIPLWIVLACQTAMALGTWSGGWRIVKTMGQKITKLRPFEGFSAETAGAITLFATALMGIPVSTTHTITGAIIGTGIIKRLSAIKWKVTLNLIWSWIITIPITALLAAFLYWIAIEFLK